MPPACKKQRPIDEAERGQRIVALRRDLATLPLAQRFERIHELQIYRGEISHSGHASDPYETRALKTWLPDLANRLNAWRVLDAPCGDCLWMADVDFLGAEYFGVDIVPALIDRNRELYGDRANFLCLDVTAELPPDADLIVCRDLLIHLSFVDSLRVLRRFCETEARWLVTTTYLDHMVNSDIPSGDFYAVNLEREPFCLPPPLEVHLEGSTLGDGEFRDKALALWSLKDVRARLEIIDRTTSIHAEHLKRLRQQEEDAAWERPSERADPDGHRNEEGAHANE